MKKINKLEDSLNGGYSGLYGEVVTFDSYKIKQLNFIPDVVIDLGANVGVFTRFARELFPNAFIVSVEPDEENYDYLVRFADQENVRRLEEKIRCLNAAIGEGKIVKRTDANAMINGSHASYIPENLIGESKYSTTAITIPTLMLDNLFGSYVKEGDKVLVKIDIEGSEFCMIEHEPSLKCLERTDYFAFELHHEMEYYTEEEKVIKRKAISKFIQRLSKTHSIIHETVHLFGTKK